MDYDQAPMSNIPTTLTLADPGIAPSGVDQTLAAERNRALASMLRRSLDDARGNPKIREQLEHLAQDADRVDAIVRTLGARHALVRDLSFLVRKPAADSRA